MFSLLDSEGKGKCDKNDFRNFCKNIAEGSFDENAFEAGFKTLESDNGSDSLNFEDIKLIVLNDLR